MTSHKLLFMLCVVLTGAGNAFAQTEPATEGSTAAIRPAVDALLDELSSEDRQMRRVSHADLSTAIAEDPAKLVAELSNEWMRDATSGVAFERASSAVADGVAASADLEPFLRLDLGNVPPFVACGVAKGLGQRVQAAEAANAAPSEDSEFSADFEGGDAAELDGYGVDGDAGESVRWLLEDAEAASPESTLETEALLVLACREETAVRREAFRSLPGYLAELDETWALILIEALHPDVDPAERRSAWLALTKITRENIHQSHAAWSAWGSGPGNFPGAWPTDAAPGQAGPITLAATPPPTSALLWPAILCGTLALALGFVIAGAPRLESATETPAPQATIREVVGFDSLDIQIEAARTHSHKTAVQARCELSDLVAEFSLQQAQA